MDDLLFIYGTLLLPGNEFADYLREHSRFYAYGRFHGKLYDTGDYPGAVYEPGIETYVCGKIVLPDDPAGVLEAMDDYEGFGAGQPQPNEFTRERLDISITEKTVKCWVYLYRMQVEHLVQILSGDYLHYKTEGQKKIPG